MTPRTQTERHAYKRRYDHANSLHAQHGLSTLLLLAVMYKMNRPIKQSEMSAQYVLAFGGMCFISLSIGWSCTGL